MKIEKLDLTADPYSHEPMSFLKPRNALDLGAALQIHLIEHGAREARENWQRAQLINLLKFAWERSGFWKRRLGGSGKFDKIKLVSLPVLTRADLNEQFETEKCLIGPADRLQVYEDKTSGSSGTPTRFFKTAMNKDYSNFSGLLLALQYPSEWSSHNLTIIKYEPDPRMRTRVEKSKVNNGPFEGFLRDKIQKTITYRPESLDELIRELRKDRIGRLTTYPWTLDIILRHISLEKLKSYGCDTVALTGGNIEQELIDRFREAGIALSSTYSCIEIGLIGVSCPDHPGRYHVRNTNVIVEIDPCSPQFSEPNTGNVLVTALHSYATPLIRYEVGDVATYLKRCPCGHDGPTLERVHGRSKCFIVTKDGSYRQFLPIPSFYSWLVDYKEYRFIQTGLGRMQLFLGGRSDVDADERQRFEAMVDAAAGEPMDLEIICCDKIDWGAGGKRLAFRCDIR